jgi:hypothetical protein
MAVVPSLTRMVLVAEALSAWRRAERLARCSDAGSQEHARALLLAARLRDAYRVLTAAPPASAEVLAAMRHVIASSRASLGPDPHSADCGDTLPAAQGRGA